MQVALGKGAMITRRETTSQPAWRHELARAISDPDTLLEALGLDRSLLPGARDAARRFRLRVPLGYVARMVPRDPHDPLLRQVLPLGDELAQVEGYVDDPVGDRSAEITPGLLQKYAGRALLITSGACAVNCRYCFRREFPYARHSATRGKWVAVVEAIANDPSIDEVILSGGDPLMLSDERLRELTDALAHVPHLARLRVHTRMPVVLPERVDDGLERWLSSLPWPIAVVVHANHAREIDHAVSEGFRRMREAGAVLLNQSVLLKGVNDGVGPLAELSDALFAAGVLPYYLHMLDPVSGAAHFGVGEPRGRRIMAALRDCLPGYLVPRLVRETVGAGSKHPVDLTPMLDDSEAVSPPLPM